MADIIQAAKWMQEGKRVRIYGWEKWVQSAEASETGQVFTSKSGVAFALDVDDLLSDDWEVCE